MTKNGLIIFLKYPEEGKVKTRLAKDYDKEFATEFYRLCVEKLIDDIKSNSGFPMNVFLFCDERNNIQKIKNWLGNDFQYCEQKGNDLGVRMNDAFKNIFGKGFNKVVIAGTDIPDLTSKIINSSFELLDKYDCIIGPSGDGGYYLLGLNQNYPDIFKKINWSSEQVLSQTINKLGANNLSYYLLKELIDIDTGKDLLEWLRNQPKNSTEKVASFVINYIRQTKIF